MNEYLEKLNKLNESEELLKIEEYGKNNGVPIITYDSLKVLQLIIKLKNVKSVLEIGTAIGYSSLQMASLDKDIKIDTIERNEEMYKIAISNIEKLNAKDQITVHFDDALTIDIKELRTSYDLIFIDAAKAQYQKFFDRYSPLLKEDGIIVTDNILFHGCVESLEGLSKNVRNMAKKIDNYNHYLSTLDDFVTTYLDLGDGLAVTMRKK